MFIAHACLHFVASAITSLLRLLVGALHLEYTANVRREGPCSHSLKMSVILCIVSHIRSPDDGSVSAGRRER